MNLSRFMQQYYDDKAKYSPNWDKRFEPLITKIMERRAELLDLDPNEIQGQVNLLFRNLDYIKFVNSKEMAALGNSEDTLGTFFPDQRKIVLNYQEIKRNSRSEDEFINNISEILMHETGHAITYNSAKDEFGVSGKRTENKTSAEYVALDEVIRETEATYMSRKPTTKEINNFKMDTIGYRNLTFFVPMISATFGVDEREFLRHAQGDKAKLDEFLLSNLEDKEFGKQALEGMYKNLNILYSYDVKGNNLNKEENTKRAMQNLCDLAIKTQDIRLNQNERIDDIGKFINDEKYNKTKLETVMENAILQNAHLYGEENRNDILGKVNNYHKYTRKKLEALEYLENNYSMFMSMPDGKRIFAECFKKFKTKNVTSKDIEFMKNKFGIDMNGIGEKRIYISEQEKKNRQIRMSPYTVDYKDSVLSAIDEPIEEKNVYLNDSDRYVYKGNSKFLKWFFENPIMRRWASKCQNLFDKAFPRLSEYIRSSGTTYGLNSSAGIHETPKKPISLYNINDLGMNTEINNENGIKEVVKEKEEIER